MASCERLLALAEVVLHCLNFSNPPSLKDTCRYVMNESHKAKSYASFAKYSTSKIWCVCVCEGWVDSDQPRKHYPSPRSDGKPSVIHEEA